MINSTCGKRKKYNTNEDIDDDIIGPINGNNSNNMNTNKILKSIRTRLLAGFDGDNDRNKNNNNNDDDDDDASFDGYKLPPTRKLPAEDGTGLLGLAPSTPNNNNSNFDNATVEMGNNDDIYDIIVDNDDENENNAELHEMMGNDTHDDNQLPGQIIFYFSEFLSDPSPELFRPEFLSMYIEDETALTQAIRTQNVEAVRVLIEAGADANGINKKNVAPIAAAANRGNVDIIQLLVNAGAIMNALNGSGSTALIQAAHFGHVEAVRLLIENNAYADYANLKGTTALMRASQEGHVDISKELIKAGADVNKKNHEGMNALMLASQRGHAEMAQLLVQNGASMDEQTSQGSTALMLACKRGNRGCVEVLVAAGAEIFMNDSRGRTARDTAIRRQHDDLLEFLDTQVQIRKIQEKSRKKRSVLLAELRRNAYQGHLCLNSSEERIDSIYRAVIANDVNSPLMKDPNYSTAVSTIRNLSQENVMTNLDPILTKTRLGYAEWQWPVLLLRCFKLPPGIFELIAEMLPEPRIWSWSLKRLRRRCKLSPVDAIKDISIIMDEILTDLNIFNGTEHSNLLVKIARNPQIHNHLLNHFRMPPRILEQLCLWSDVQSLVNRTNDLEITFKYPVAKKMLASAIFLFKWYSHRSMGVRVLDLIYSFPYFEKTQRLENDAVDSNDASDPEDVNVENDTETEPLDGEDDADDDSVESAIHSIIHF